MFSLTYANFESNHFSEHACAAISNVRIRGVFMTLSKQVFVKIINGC